MQTVTPNRFFALRGRENPLDSNLTELLAAESVDRGFINHNDWLAHVLRYQYVCSFLTKNPTSDVLDIGCGRMQLPYYAHRNRIPPVNSYWGLDLRATQTWLDDLQWKTPLNLVRADFVLDYDDINDLPDFPQKFDVVVYMEAMEHIPREYAPQSLDNAYFWLKPGGRFFFSTPNAGVSDSTAENHIGPDGVSREWTYKEKYRMLEESGFQVLNSFGTFGAVRRLPPEAMKDPSLIAARAYLSTSMFTNFAFIGFPEHANNALFECVKP